MQETSWGHLDACKPVSVERQLQNKGVMEGEYLGGQILKAFECYAKRAFCFCFFLNFLFYIGV